MKPWVACFLVSLLGVAACTEQSGVGGSAAAQQTDAAGQADSAGQADAAGLEDLASQPTPAAGLVVTNARVIDGTGRTLESATVVVPSSTRLTRSRAGSAATAMRPSASNARVPPVMGGGMVNAWTAARVSVGTTRRAPVSGGGSSSELQPNASVTAMAIPVFRAAVPMPMPPPPCRVPTRDD
jgi:hypothetical protein